jgi:hypothetical protein
MGLEWTGEPKFSGKPKPAPLYPPQNPHNPFKILKIITASINLVYILCLLASNSDRSEIVITQIHGTGLSSWKPSCCLSSEQFYVKNIVDRKCLYGIMKRYIRSKTNSMSEPKLYYDRRSVGQYVSVSSPIWGPRPDFYSCQTIEGLLMSGALSNDRTGLSFMIPVDPRQSSHSRVAGLRTIFFLSEIRDSPSLEDQVPVFISPRNRVAQL